MIPTFNRAYCLERAIESVLKQTFINFEIILVDDGSTDNTQELIENKYFGRLKYLKSENRGVSAARNLGIRASMGDWIAFLDSDDEWLSDHLERQWDYHLKKSDIRLIHGEEIWIRNGQHLNHKKKASKIWRVYF